MIDLAELPDINSPIPSDDNHRHFGKGQTEAVIEFEPGDHTLQLMLGDHMHIPHDPVVVSKSSDAWCCATLTPHGHASHAQATAIRWN